MAKSPIAVIYDANGAPIHSDGFGRLSTSSPVTQFDNKLIYDSNTLIWDEAQISGSGTSGTYNTNQASYTLSVSNATAGVRARQSYGRYSYQAGKTARFAMTGILGSPATGITRRIGAFDDKNGVFFETNATTARVVRRSYTSGSAVDAGVSQTNWNIDKFDGTGPSGITLDFSKTQIFIIEFQWLGVGSVWYGFDIDGSIHWCHRMDHSNTLTTVYMSTPNLPVRFEISNNGSGAAASMTQICATASSAGGVDEVGKTRAIYRETAFTTNNNTSWYPLIAVRLASGFEGTLLRLKKISINCQSTADYTWRLVINPTIVGTALSFSSLSQSGIEYQVNTTSATTITGGVDIEAESTQQSNSGIAPSINPGEIRLGASIAGVSDILVLAIRRDSGSNESFFATMTLLEQN